MTSHILMGGINIATNEYEYPRIANKKNKYKCPDCNKDLILKKGMIKAHHFSHYKSDNPCNYYGHPTESQIHKDAKMAMKNLLDNKRVIFIHRTCILCKLPEPIKSLYNSSNLNTENCIYQYNDKSKAVIEHNFKYNEKNKYADVALLEEEKIQIIFEIYHTHSTYESDRPDPWFEIDATQLLNQINVSLDESIYIYCKRLHTCSICEDTYKKKQQQLYEEQIKKRYEFEEQIKKRNEFEEQIKIIKEQNKIIKEERIKEIEKQYNKNQEQNKIIKEHNKVVLNRFCDRCRDVKNCIHCDRCGDLYSFKFSNNFNTCNRCKSIIECFIDRGYGDKSYTL